jgi:hypothetical protein
LCIVDRKGLIEKYKRAKSIIIIKSGKSLLSRDSDDVIEVFCGMIRHNIEEYLDAGMRHGRGTEISFGLGAQKSIGFMIIGEEVINKTRKSIESRIKKVMENVSADSVSIERIHNLSSAYMAVIPEASTRIAHDDAVYVQKRLSSVLASVVDSIATDVSADLKESEKSEIFKRTIYRMEVESVAQMRGIGMGCPEYGWVYLEYFQPPAPAYSSLSEEVLFEVDVQDSDQEGIEASPNTRTLWIRPCDSVIKTHAQRIRAVAAATPRVTD